MIFKETSDGYFLCLSRGEKVMETLVKFAKEKKISSATINGLGALMNTRLGFYHLHQKKYDEKMFSDEMELVNLTGNVSRLSDKNPAVHCHVTLGDTSFRAIAGHLFEAEVAVTCEIFLGTKNVTIMRLPDDAIGLNLWRLDQ